MESSELKLVPLALVEIRELALHFPLIAILTKGGQRGGIQSHGDDGGRHLLWLRGLYLSGLCEVHLDSRRSIHPVRLKPETGGMCEVVSRGPKARVNASEP